MTDRHLRFFNRLRQLAVFSQICNRRPVAANLPLALPSILAIFLSACATSGNVVTVESENQDTRVRVIVIHFTTADFQDSLNILTRDSSNPVSSHYLVPEPGDPSYTKKDMNLYSLVDEEARAWHAGSSYWAGKTSLNDMSVGIELVNRAWCHRSKGPVTTSDIDSPPDSICFYPDFADEQLAILADLLEGILARHPDVKPTHIVGHADITPQRKVDPGPRFPWQRLYRLGFGAWYDDETVIRHWEVFRNGLPPVETLQRALNTYGYDIEADGVHDARSRNVVQAFQMHFLPWRVSGEFCPETAAVLYALIEKYYESELEGLLPAENLPTNSPDKE